MSYDGTYGETNKVLAFLQQFDVAFGGKDFDEGAYSLFRCCLLHIFSQMWPSALLCGVLLPCPIVLTHLAIDVAALTLSFQMVLHLQVVFYRYPLAKIFALLHPPRMVFSTLL